MWIWGMDSKYGSEKNIEYVRRSYLQKKNHIEMWWNIYKNSVRSESYSKGSFNCGLAWKN